MTPPVAAHIGSLQAIRGVAAAMVVLYHTGTLFAVHTGEVLWGNVFRAGFAGVDIFFVLSGIVIYWIHGRDFARPERAGAFVAKRALRLLPVYWVVVLLKALKDPAAATASTLGAALLLLPVQRPFITVAWTLSYEVLFYLLFGLCIVLPRRRWALLPLGVMLVLGVGNWPWSLGTGPGVGDVALRFLFNAHLLEFLMGVAIAWFLRSRPVPPRAGAAGLALLGGAGFVLAAFLTTASSNGLAAVSSVTAHDVAELGNNPWVNVSPYVFGIPAALCVAGVMALELGGVQRWPLQRVLGGLGDISYSLYLVHGFVIHALLGHARLGPWLHANTWGLVLVWAVAVGLATLSYRLIERPSLALGRRYLQSRPLHARPGRVQP